MKFSKRIFTLREKKRMAKRIKEISPDMHFGGMAHVFPEEYIEKYDKIKSYTLPDLLSSSFKITRIKLRDAEKL